MGSAEVSNLARPTWRNDTNSQSVIKKLDRDHVSVVVMSIKVLGGSKHCGGGRATLLDVHGH